MGQLDGKVAIISGSSKGMGAMHAKKLVSEGAKVVITANHEQPGTDLAHQLGDDCAIFVKQDVTKEDDWRNVVKQAMDRWGKIDILINNAGIEVDKSLFDITAEEYMKIVEINQLSQFLGIKIVGKVMKEQKSGSIVNVSSMDGIVGGVVGYTDTKFAVRGLAKAAAIELSPFNVRVNSIHPGVIQTRMIEEADDKVAVEQLEKTIPMKRIASPEEVSNMIAYMVSDQCSYSTGAEFLITGGLLAQ